MLIRCQECNHENQLGAIFCRNCGAKLDIEAIKPKVKDSSSFDFAKFFRHLIGLVIFLSLVGVIAGLFIPYGFKEYSSLDEAAQNTATKKYKIFWRRVKRIEDKRKYTFTPEEATFIFNNTFIEKIAESGEGSSYLIQDLIFDTDDEANVHLILNTKLAGKVPVRFELTGTLEPPEQDQDPQENSSPKKAKRLWEFHIIGAKMGHIPMPEILWDKIIEKYQPLLEDTRVQEILKNIKNVTVDTNNNFAVTLK